MTTTPPEAPPGPPGPAGEPGPEPGSPDQGPRVTRDEIRDLGRLRRSVGDRKVAGVAGGLARHLDIDPLILRVAFVVLAFFGGAGLLVYGACWLLLPTEGTDEATLRLDERSRGVALALVGLVAALVLIGDSWGGWGFPWPLAIIGLIVLVIVSTRSSSGPRQHPGPLTSTGEPGYAYAGPVRAPRKRGPILFWFTMALIALVLGTMCIVDLAGAPVAESAYPATALGLIGLVLVLGAFWGRAGGLILAGLMAATATVGATVAGEVDAGQIESTPQTAAALDARYEITAGEIVLDLTEIEDLDALDGRTIRLEADFGRVEVIVPPELDVEVDATIEGAGETELFDDRQDSSNTASYDGGTDAPQLDIDVDVVFGEIEIDTPGRFTS